MIKLSVLQQKLYSLIVDDATSDPVLSEIMDSAEEWESYLSDLAKDISKLNAAELRHNIKVFEDVDKN